MALSPYDQSVYDAGFKYIPQSRYLLNPFEIPQGTENDVPSGIPALYQAQGGGSMAYTGGIGDLMSGFQTSVDSRQDRLRELNRPLAEAQFPSFPGAMTPGGYSANTMYNQALKDLNDPSLKGMSNDFVGKRAQDVMDYADNAIQDYRMQYATGELGPNYIPAEKPTLSRKIQDAIYGILPGGKPQTAEMILNEGYNNPYGVGGPGILGAILGKFDNYHNLSRADQAFIAANMGYTGPTVFGENPTGNYKDPFGINVRSARGNYGAYVDKTASSLEDALDRARNKYDTEEEFLAMTKMMRNKLNFYRQKQKEYADTIAKAAKIQAEKDKDIVNKINVTSDDVASTTTQGGGGGIADPGYGPGGGLDASKMGGGSQQAKSGGQKAGGTGRTDGGWGWADGGIVDLVDIYD
jgi:hypothetical protein